MSHKKTDDQRKVIVTLTLDSAIITSVEATRGKKSRSQAINDLILAGTGAKDTTNITHYDLLTESQKNEVAFAARVMGNSLLDVTNRAMDGGIAAQVQSAKIRESCEKETP